MICLLNLSYTVTIFSLLLCLMSSIQGGSTGVAVARCVRIKLPYIKKGTLLLAPESPHMDDYPGFFLMVSSLWFKDLSSKRLQRWFDGDTMTQSGKPLSSDVSQSIVVNKCEVSMFAYHSMICRDKLSYKTNYNHIEMRDPGTLIEQSP